MPEEDASLAKDAKEVERMQRKIRHHERKLKKSLEAVKQRKTVDRTTKLSDSQQGKSPLEQRPINSLDGASTQKQLSLVTATPTEKSKSRGPAVEKAPKASVATRNPDQAKDHRTVQLKVLVVGDTKCGKTSIIQRFCYVSTSLHINNSPTLPIADPS